MLQSKEYVLTDYFSHYYYYNLEDATQELCFCCSLPSHLLSSLDRNIVTKFLILYHNRHLLLRLTRDIVQISTCNASRTSISCHCLTASIHPFNSNSTGSSGSRASAAAAANLLMLLLQSSRTISIANGFVKILTGFNFTCYISHRHRTEAVEFQDAFTHKISLVPLPPSILAKSGEFRMVLFFTALPNIHSPPRTSSSN